MQPAGRTNAPQSGCAQRKLVAEELCTTTVRVAGAALSPWLFVHVYLTWYVPAAMKMAELLILS
jgi:hypothetical protein